MSGVVTEVCPWFTHWLCVVPLGGPLCHRTLSTPSLSLAVQKSAPGPEEAMRYQRRWWRDPKSWTQSWLCIHSLCRPCSANPLKLYQEVLWASSICHLFPLRRVPVRDSLGLLEDRALALALLLVRSKGGPGEELGVWSRAARYLGNEVLPNWIRKFHQVA